MPPDLSSKVYAIYEKYGTKYCAGGRSRWSYGLGMKNTPEYLEGYSIDFYGQNADKFYLYRLTKAQKDQVLNAITKAAIELEKE